MEAWVYDEECYPNFWCATFRHVVTREKIVFKIDEEGEIDDRRELREFVKGKFIIGYNNHNYDDPLLNYVIDPYTTYSLTQIKEFSNKLITSKDDAYYKDPEIKRYRWNKVYKSIDLLRHNFAKMHWVSLKELEVTLKWKNVKEIPYFHDIVLTNEQKEEVLEYNDNDTLATCEVFDRSIDGIKLRHAIFKEFGFECYSKDGVKTGVELLLKMYCKRTGEDPYEVGQRRTYRTSINLSDVISDKVEFKSKTFKDLLEKLKNTTIKDTRGEFSFEVLYGGVMHGYGTGGIHSRDRSGVIIPKPGYRYIDADVTSLYPSILIEYGFKPEHVSEVFIEIYKFLRDERVRAKKSGKKLIAETYKLSLNGAYGNLISEHSWLYDPKAAMGVTLNGQLFLTMLSESLIDAGIQVDSLNTDGITALVRDDQMEDYWRITKWWQEHTRLGLEFREYEKVARLNVNAYYAVYKDDKEFNEGDAGKVKEKGDLSTKIVLGKGFDKPIVKIAVRDYFTKGIPIEETIRNHKDIYDFTMFQKVGEQFQVEWWGKKQQRINRYYASKQGAYLYKVKGEGSKKKYHHMLKGVGVQIFNIYEEKPIEEYKIDYQYYITEARKLINEIDSKQIDMFIKEEKLGQLIMF